MKVGFIGLGAMGRGMALNLLKHGVGLSVYARRREVLTEFEALGAPATDNLAEMADKDVLFFCVPDEKAVRSMLYGECGLAPMLRRGAIIVDCSTISYAAAREFAEDMAQRDICYLDAPVSGLAQRADDGTLTIMCGGNQTAFETVKPLLSHMGAAVLYMGDSGCGQLSKMINNVLYNINIAAMAEMFPMAVKLGLDPETLARVVNSSTGSSYASTYFLPRILEDEFFGTFPMDNAYKDMRSAAELAAQTCVPTPVFHAALTTYQQSMLQGYGQCDKGAMIRLYEELSGVRVRKKVPAQNMAPPGTGKPE